MGEPGLPLTTGEGNTGPLYTAERFIDALMESAGGLPPDEPARSLARHALAFAAECGRLREQRDKLGNELAQERAKPGGSWDQAAFAQVQDEAGRLRGQLDAARREVDSQMQSKLDAQVTLKAVTEALDLRFDELGDGWREAAPKILARIETIVDEADRAFRERDALREQLDALVRDVHKHGDAIDGYDGGLHEHGACLVCAVLFGDDPARAALGVGDD